MATPDPSTRPRAAMLRFGVPALFGLSGISGLVYEVAWERQLVIIFGNTALATATVLSAFMAGLAAGSYVFGRFADREGARLLRMYALLEGGVAGFALAFPLLLWVATPVYAGAYRLTGGSVVCLNVMRLVVSLCLVSVPAFLMGGALPLLAKLRSARARSLGRNVGVLYSVNTLGGLAGCLACGFLLLPTVGIFATTLIAAALNVTVAASAWAMSRRFHDLAPPRFDLARDGTQAPHTHKTIGLRTRSIVVAGVCVSGFSALACEVLWSRMLGTVLGSSMYSFTLTLAIFLGGIAVGSAVYARFLVRLRRQTLVFAAVEIGIGTLAYLTPYALLWAPLGAAEGFPAILRAVALMSGPAILMGAALPCAIGICRRSGAQAGGSVGDVYAMNAIGSALGPVAAGFVVMPLLGIQRGLLVFASLNALAGVALLWDREPSRARRGAYAGALALVLVLAGAFGPTTLFRRLYEDSEPRADVVHYREGAAANVVVYDFHRAGYRDLFLNASEEASTRVWHVQLFRLLGALPAIVHGEPEDAVMIAFGAGISAGACIDLVDDFECVELNPDVREVAEIFKTENRDVFSNPKLKLIVNDGRNHLLLSNRRRSLIVSDATNPISFDAWTLYTREFYELCRARLAAGGVFCQWVPIHLPGDALKTVLKTFTSVFPHASVWSVYGSTQCLMLATPERLRIDLADLRRRLPTILEKSGLADCGVDTPEKLLSFFLIGEDGLRAMLDGFDKVNTDDLPHTQFVTGLDREGVRSSVELLRWQEDVLAYVSDADAVEEDARARLRAYASISRMLNLGFLLSDDREFSKAAALASHVGLDDENVKNALGFDRMRKAYFVDRRRTHPADANARRALGFILWKEGDHAGALEELGRATRLKPDYADAHLLTALVHMDARQPDAATRKLLELRNLSPTREVVALVPRALRIVHLLRKLGHEPDDPRLNAMLAEAYLEFGWFGKAFATARAALERSPGDVRMSGLLAGVYESLDLAGEALATLRELTKAFPGDERLAARARELELVARDPDAHRRWRAAKVPASADPSRGEPAPDDSEAAYRRAIEIWNERDELGKVEPAALTRAADAMAELARAGASDARICEDTAVLHELLGRHDEAASFWRRCAEASPSDRVPPYHVKRLELITQLRGTDLPKEETAELHNKIGGLHWQSGEIEKAIRSFERALADDPRHAVALANIGMCRIATGGYAEAVAALEQGLAVGRDEGYATELENRLRWLRRVLARDGR